MLDDIQLLTTWIFAQLRSLALTVSLSELLLIGFAVWVLRQIVGLFRSIKTGRVKS